MSISRYAQATWQGSGMEGTGTLISESKLIQNAVFNFKDRFSVMAKHTNPEELLAAAQASCFVMKLSFILNEAGYIIEELCVSVKVDLENGRITVLALLISAKVQHLTKSQLNEYCTEALQTCPICMILKANITYEVKIAIS